MRYCPFATILSKHIEVSISVNSRLFKGFHERHYLWDGFLTRTSRLNNEILTLMNDLIFEKTNKYGKGVHSLNMVEEKRVVIDEKILGGKPVIRGTRIPVYLIVELVANGLTIKDILKEYPELSEDDVRTALRYAASLLKRKTYYEISSR